MRKIFLALMCFASATMFATCSNQANGSSSEAAGEQSEQKASTRAIDIKDAVEPLILVEDETALEGYLIEPNLVSEIKDTYGIEQFGRPKGLDVKMALSFTGDGEFSYKVDAFMFEFVPKEGKLFGHDLFEAYAKAIFEKCLKAADDGQIVDGFYANSKPITFEQSLKVIDKQQDRKKCLFYYINQGRQRKISIVERQFKEGGFANLQIELVRNGSY